MVENITPHLPVSNKKLTTAETFASKSKSHKRPIRDKKTGRQLTKVAGKVLPRVIEKQGNPYLGKKSEERLLRAPKSHEIEITEYAYKDNFTDFDKNMEEEF